MNSRQNLVTAPTPPTTIFRRATVTQASPLRVRLDGDATALSITPDTTVAGLAVGDRVRVMVDGTRLEVLGRFGGLGLLSAPNRIINPNFMVNQQANTSGSVVIDGGYFLDGWKNTSGISTGLITWADSGGVRTVTIGSAGNSRNISGYVEAANVSAGVYTLSWTGTAVGTVFKDGGSEPTTAASPVTVTLDGTGNARIRFYGLGGTLSNVKLEFGGVASPYQSPTYDENLRACQRFYYNPLADITNADANIAQGTADSTTNARIIVPLPVPMRATPTLVTSGAFALYNGSAVAITSLVLSGWTTAAVPVLYVGVASGLTANRSYLFKRNTSSSASLAFDARL